MEKKAVKAKKVVKKVTRKPVKWELSDLNPRQLKVLTLVKSMKAVNIEDLARKAFPGVRPAKKAKWWTRNQLRDLFNHKFLKKVSRGTYTAA